MFAHNRFTPQSSWSSTSVTCRFLPAFLYALSSCIPFLSQWQVAAASLKSPWHLWWPLTLIVEVLTKLNHVWWTPCAEKGLPGSKQSHTFRSKQSNEIKWAVLSPCALSKVASHHCLAHRLCFTCQPWFRHKQFEAANSAERNRKEPYAWEPWNLWNLYHSGSMQIQRPVETTLWQPTEIPSQHVPLQKPKTNWVEDGQVNVRTWRISDIW